MTKLFLPAAALALALAAGASAPALAASKAAAAAAPAVTKTAKADCMKQWHAQKTHSETRRAFLAACERKA